MSKNYTHLGLQQRYQIEALLATGQTQKQIAQQLNVHPSTISRELKRNVKISYKAQSANEHAQLRHRIKPKLVIFSMSMKRLIFQLLVDKRWSPEIISVVAMRQDIPMVSHEWIYQWIWYCKHTDRAENRPFKEAHRYLRHSRYKHKRGNRKRCRGVIENRTPISERPEIVQQRKRSGDLEVDLMVGKGHQQAVLVITDRATLHTRLKKLPDKDSKNVARKIISCLRSSQYPIHTLTFDNDQSFRHHEKIAKALGAKAYFTRPYTSQDKGTVENRIGVLRRFLPKPTDLNFVSVQQLKAIEQLLNDRPVKKFNYLTPNLALQQKIALIS